MTQLLSTPTDTPVRARRSVHQLTAHQSRAARAMYERLGHHRHLCWNDLPDWQQAGYHRLVLADQLAAMQRSHHSSSAIQTRQTELRAAVAASAEANGWQLLLSYCAPPDGSLECELQFRALVRQVLIAAADHLGPAR